MTPLKWIFNVELLFLKKMDQVEAKFKLNQKNNSKDRNSIIENLSQFVGEQGKLLADVLKKDQYFLVLNWLKKNFSQIFVKK